MPKLDPALPVHSFVTDAPAAARVFDRHQIDYCCRGAESLRESCERGGIDLEQVLQALEALEESPVEELDLAELGLTELADHIVATHHDHLRSELPLISEKLAKVVRAHGGRDSRLFDLQRVFAAFKAELESHMLKEEEVLFPLCRALESGTGAESVSCGSVDGPISVMLHEHEEAGGAMQRMRELTDGFVAPEESCQSHRTLLSQLDELERDLHRHVHKENYLLFPRAIAREAATRERDHR